MRHGLWLCLALVVGCRQTPVPVPERPAPTTLDEVVHRTQLAFWPEGSTFTAALGSRLMRADATGLSLDSSLRFGVATVGRDGRAPLASGALRRRADGSMVRESAAVTELLENTEAGLEQSWHFAQAPRGSGDLVVRITVENGGAAEASESGLHFEAQGTRVTYGHGTWVDARGVRTAVRAQLDGAGLVLRVPEALVADSEFPAVLDPLISIEKDVEQAGVGPAGTVSHYSIASNGSVLLAVWPDTLGRAMGARVTADGRLLDPWGIVLPAAGSRPIVASNGTDFLVVAVGPTALAFRVRASGQIDPPVSFFPPNIQYQYPEVPVLASAGSDYVLVDVEGNGAPTVVARTFAADGSLLSTSEVTNSGVPRRPKLAVGGSTVLVVYDDMELLARRLDLNLSLLDFMPISLGEIPDEFNVAWDGQRFVITRQLNSGLTASRVSTAGAVIDPTPLTVVAPGYLSSHGVEAEDGGVRLVWENGPELHAARLGSTGGLVTSGARPNSLEGGQSLSITRAGSDFLIASAVDQSILGLRMGADFRLLDPAPFVISGGPARQRTPALAWNGTHYLAAWEVSQGGSAQQSFITRLARDGTPLVPWAQPISPPRSLSTRTSVASNGREWLVSWVQFAPSAMLVRAARVSADGDLLDDGGVTLTEIRGSLTGASIAWLGDRYGIIYSTQYPVPPYDYELRGVLFGADGGVSSDAGTQLLRPGTTSSMTPRAVAWDGGALLVWDAYHQDGGFNVFGSRLSNTLELLDPGGFPIARGPGDQNSPALAVGPDGVLACWSDNGVTPRRTRAARITFDGRVLDDGGVAVSTGNTFPLACATAWDGEQFIVVWPSTPSPYALNSAWFSFDGGLVPDSGTRLTPAGVLHAENRAAVASQGHRQSLIIFETDSLPDAGLASRVRTRLVTRGAAPSTAPANATTPEDTAVVVPLMATDPDGDPVQFVVVQAARSGAVTSVDGGVRYEPDANFHGTDVFQLVADDGALLSPPVEIAITVTPVDDLPIARDLMLAVDEDLSTTVPVATRDSDDEPLTFSTVQAPAHGTVTGQPPSVTYTPELNFTGADEFTYSLSDGRGTAVPARVSITVRPVDDAPVATAATVTTEEDTPVDVVLAATEPDGEALTFEVLEGPARGTLTGQPPTLRFTPAPDFAGEERLVFRASDATSGSTAEVRLLVTAVNDQPTAKNLELNAQAGVPVEFAFDGADPEGGPLTFRVASGPSQGTLAGEGSTRSYTANATFSGEDSLTYEVVDEGGATATASVRFLVSATTPQPPSCGCRGTGGEAAALLLALAWLRRRRQEQTPREQLPEHTTPHEPQFCES